MLQKCFDVESCKKRVISSEQPESSDDPKNQKERSRNESTTSNLKDAFTEDLKNHDCVMVLLIFFV